MQTIATTSGNTVTVNAPTSTAGTFTYSLISVQDNSSTACINAVSGSAIITINPQPTAAIIATPIAHLCNGEASQITVTNFVSGYSYAWYKDGTFLKSTTGDTIMNNKAGSFYVVPTSDKGCAAASNSDTIIISTGTITTPVITGWLHVCPGGKTRLSIVPTDSDKPYEVWRWTDTPYGRLLSEDSSFSALAGQYRVSVEREGCYDSTLVTVTADDTVYPAGRLVINPAHIVYGAQVVLTADVTNAVSYQWDLGDGNTVNTTDSIMMQNYYRASDSLAVSVNAVSERNCITKFTAFIKVDPPVYDSIKNNSFAGNLKDEGENAIAVAGKKAGERVVLSFIGLDKVHGKVAEMAGDLPRLDGDGLSTILAGELDLGRVFDVRKSERLPCCGHLVDVLHDPGDMVHRLIALRQIGGRTGHCRQQNNHKATQPFHFSLHIRLFASSTNGGYRKHGSGVAGPSPPASPLFRLRA